MKCTLSCSIVFASIFINCIEAVELKRVLVFGGATCDVFVRYDKTDAGTMSIYDNEGKQSYLLLKEGLKIDIANVQTHSGGGAGNVATGVTKLGCHAAVHCRLGNDKNGAIIFDDLVKHGIDTSFVTYDSEAATGMAFVIPSLQGDRTILVMRGANTKMLARELPLAALKKREGDSGCDGVYVASLSGDSAKLFGPIVQEAHARGVLVATNPGMSQLRPGPSSIVHWLPFIDIMLVNITEAKRLLQTLHELGEALQFPQDVVVEGYQEQVPQLFGEPLGTIRGSKIWLKDFCKLLFSKGLRTIVVTNGNEGAYVADSARDMIYFHPIVPVKLVNTLGAGDAFGAAFFTYTLQGYSIEDAMRAGILNSASVVCFEDAKTGLLTQEALQVKVDFLAKELLKSIPLH